MEDAMAEKPQFDRSVGTEMSDFSADPPQIDTPVIDMQDLEHKPGPETRMSNKGVKIEPKMDSDDARDFASEDASALDAIEAFEKSLTNRRFRV
jgi:hypothetical protein